MTLIDPSRFTIAATADVAATRHEDFGGRDHLVIPVIALTEGVLEASNASGPELALASEFGKNPQSWNGRPVTFGHPMREGVPVSANSPQILQEESFGRLFNTIFEDNKLKSELWIDLERVEEVDKEGLSEVMTLIENGEMIEISTGFLAAVEQTPGEFNGEVYDAVWRDIQPDHLALLPAGVKGACSVESGCGAPRLNRDSEDHDCDEPKKRSPLSTLWNKFRSIISVRSNTSDISSTDTQKALELALEQESPDNFFWIVAVFHTDSNFVYEKDFSSEFLQRDFALTEDGEVVLGNDIQKVRPQTTFVPLVVIKEDIMTTNAEKVDSLITSDNSEFTDDDRTFLVGLEETQLDKIVALNEAAPEPTPQPEPEPEPIPNVLAEEEDTNEVTPEQALAGLPENVQAVLNEGLELHSKEKTSMIEQITGSEHCTFTPTELEKMNNSHLRKISALLGKTDYSGLNVLSSQEEDNVVPAPPKMFPAEQAA